MVRPEPGGDAERPVTLEPLALPEEDDERPGVEPGHRHVHDGREPEEEGESLHVPDGDEVQDDRSRSARRVGGPHRATGALEAAVQADVRTDATGRVSSFNRSKYTMYESTVMPIDTMMPVTPARSKLGAAEV